MIRLQQSDPYDGPLHDLTPDLTPMLDILFILLVFFMLTAGVVFQSLDLKLPSSVSEDLPAVSEFRHMVLEIHEDSYVIDGKTVADFAKLKSILPQLIQEKPESELVIAGGRQVAIERLLKVLVYLQSQGIEAANILMQNEKAQ